MAEQIRLRVEATPDGALYAFGDVDGTIFSFPLPEDYHPADDNGRRVGEMVCALLNEQDGLDV